jgi:hypothetical protein
VWLDERVENSASLLLACLDQQEQHDNSAEWVRTTLSDLVRICMLCDFPLEGRQLPQVVVGIDRTRSMNQELDRRAAASGGNSSVEMPLVEQPGVLCERRHTTGHGKRRRRCRVWCGWRDGLLAPRGLVGVSGIGAAHGTVRVSGPHVVWWGCRAPGPRVARWGH